MSVRLRYNALKALESGKYASLGEAAVTFNIPKSTLGHRRMGRQTRCKAHKKEQLLSSAGEEAIVKWILKLDDWGFPLRLDRLWEKLMFSQMGKKGRDMTRLPAPYPPTSDGTGLHLSSVGTLNLQHDMLSESTVNEYMPTIHLQSRIIFKNSPP